MRCPVCDANLRTSADGDNLTGESPGGRGTVAQETSADDIVAWLDAMARKAVIEADSERLVLAADLIRVHSQAAPPPFLGAFPGPVVDGAPTWGAYLRDVPDEGYEVYRPQPPLVEDIWTPSVETEWAPNAWALVRRTPQPATERVPWHEAVDSRRKAEFAYSDGITDRYATVHSGGWCVLAKTMCVRDSMGDRIRDVESDGTVEVLVEDEETAR